MATKSLFLGTLFNPAVTQGLSGPLSVLHQFSEHPIQANGDFSGQSDGSFITGPVSDLILSRTAATVNGTDYLVIYRGQGADTTQPPPNLAETTVRLMMNGTKFAESKGSLAGHVGSSSGEHWHGGQIRGFTILTGDGSVLEVRGDIGEADTHPSSDNYNFGACGIVALPLSNSNDGYDYFSNISDSDSDVTIPGINSGLNGNDTDRTLTRTFGDDVSVASTMHQLTFTAPDDGDYLLLWSFECRIDNTSSNQKCIFFYPTLDGTLVGGSFIKVHDQIRGSDFTPDRTEYHSVMHQQLVNLSAGNHTIDIRCLKSDDQVDFAVRRPRLIALRGLSFAGMSQSQLTVGAPGSAESVAPPDVYDGTNYTVGFSEVSDLNRLGVASPSIALANIGIAGGESTTLGAISPAGGISKLVSTDSGTGFNEGAGSYVHRTRPWRGGMGYFPTLLVGCESRPAGDNTTWQAQYATTQAGFGGVYIGRSATDRMSPDPPKPAFHGSNPHSGTLTSAGNTGGSVNGNAFMIDSGASFGTLTGTDEEGWLTITSGAGSGQGRRILVNDSTEIEFQDSWATIPSPGDSYEVWTGVIPVGDSLGKENVYHDQNIVSFFGYTVGRPPVEDGIELHLDFSDASTVITSGSDVTGFEAKSGGYTFTRDATNSTDFAEYDSGIARNGRQVMRFNDDAVYLSSTDFSLTGNPAWTLCMVIEYDTSITTQVSVSWGGTANGTLMNYLGQDISGTFRYGLSTQGAGDYFNSDGSNSAVWQSHTLRTPGSVDLYDFEHRRNRATDPRDNGNSSDGTPAIGTGPIRIGGKHDSDSGDTRFDGRIAEILIYNRELTAGERDQVEDYLHAKWNVA